MQTSGALFKRLGGPGSASLAGVPPQPLVKDIGSTAESVAISPQVRPSRWYYQEKLNYCTIFDAHRKGVMDHHGEPPSTAWCIAPPSWYLKAKACERRKPNPGRPREARQDNGLERMAGQTREGPRLPPWGPWTTLV